MGLAQRLAAGAALACALGLLAHRIAAPLPITSPAAPPSLSRPAPFPVFSSTPSAELAISPSIQLDRQCLGLAENDPLAAMEFALKHNLTADDPGLLTSLLMQWASQDFDAASDWTKAQEAGPWRDNMLARLAYLRAQADPLAAARLVVTDMPAGRARDEAIISVVHQWALRDADAAAHWARSFDDEALRLRASAEVAGVLAASAPEQATR